MESIKDVITGSLKENLEDMIVCIARITLRNQRDDLECKPVISVNPVSSAQTVRKPAELSMSRLNTGV